MSDLSDHAEDLLATWLLTDDAVTRPSGTYVALYNAVPSDAGGGTEVTGGGYARVLATFTSTMLAGVFSNASEINIPATGGDFGTILAIGIFDALSAGNLLAWKEVSALPVSSGQSARFLAGSLQVRFQ